MPVNKLQSKYTFSDINFSEEKLQHQSKDELIQTIKHLIRDNEHKDGIIQYQKEENHSLTDRLINKNLQKESNDKLDDEGTLLPLLEAMEEEPIIEKKSKIGKFLSDAFLNKNSKYYKPVNDFIVALIFFSVFTVTLESVPYLMERWGGFFYWSEMIVVCLFSLEYAINIYVSDNKLGYIFGVWGVIDLLAIVPSYFHIIDLRDIKMARTLRIIRFLRTIRMLRVLKLTKETTAEYNRAKHNAHTFKLDLQIYMTTLFTVITIFSTLMYYAERNVPNTPFVHIPAAMWWCVVTITTVGYGDMQPLTFIGKIIAAIAMIMGLALLGLLMNVIGKAMMTSLFGTSKID